VEVTEESKSFVDVVTGSLSLDRLRVIETGGDVYTSERQQWGQRQLSSPVVGRLRAATRSASGATPGVKNELWRLEGQECGNCH